LIFAASTILFSLIGLLYRTYFYIFEISDSGYFYNDNIIDIFSMQAVYYAVYVNIAIFILLHFMLAKQQIVRLPNWTLLVAITYLVVVNFLLASRLSMLSLYLMLLVYLIVFIIKQRKYVLGGGLLLAGLAMVVALFVFFPKTIKRFESVKNTKFDFENTNPINHFNGEISETNWNGANTRLAIWTCAWEVIEDNFWLGVGPGAYSDKLNEKYMEKNFHFGLQRQYGTHNMYLQTWMMFGFLGFLFFLAFLLIPLFMALRQGEYLYAVFLVFIMLAMLTEDFFSRNQGISLFAFFNSLFAMQILQREKPKQLN
jgi:O-antigen ligase